jgi:hypothetical protein
MRPGEYSLEVVVYDGETMVPLAPAQGTPDGQRLIIGSVEVEERR